MVRRSPSLSIEGPLRSLVGALIGTAVILRLAYAISLLWFSNYIWLGNWQGADMRLVAVVNLVLIAIFVVAWLRGLPLVMLLVGATALATLALPGSRAGFVSAQLLPWATAVTAAAMLGIAARRSFHLTVVTAALLVVFAAVLVLLVAWASLDYAVAALTLLLICSALLLVADRTGGVSAA